MAIARAAQRKKEGQVLATGLGTVMDATNAAVKRLDFTGGKEDDDDPQSLTEMIGDNRKASRALTLSGCIRM